MYDYRFKRYVSVIAHPHSGLMRSAETANARIEIIIQRNSNAALSGNRCPMRHAKRRGYERSGSAIKEKSFSTNERIGKFGRLLR